MRHAYWDTSCILALYAAEPLSETVSTLVAAANYSLTSSAILEYEMPFALHARKSRGEIRAGSAQRALEAFQKDHHRGRFVLIPLGEDIKTRATLLAAQASCATPPRLLRTLDGIHLATALQMRSPELITADKRMADCARTCGITTRLLHTSEER